MSTDIQVPTIPAPVLALSSGDVYASAQGMKNYFGDGAESEARRRAQRCADECDSQGRAIWLAIAAAIDTLQPNPAASAKQRSGG